MTPAFRTLEDIEKSSWEEPIFDSNSILLPAKTAWAEDRNISIKDVKVWEQIYFHKGTVGIYAAWDPYSDFYIIVYNLFLGSELSIEEFRGVDAEDQVLSRAKDFGIDLPLNRLWV